MCRYQENVTNIYSILMLLYSHVFPLLACNRANMQQRDRILIVIVSSILSPEIIRKVKKPPPMCRPTVAPDQAPLECIQLMKQCWSEHPDRRPTFDEIFDRVTLWKYHSGFILSQITLNVTLNQAKFKKYKYSLNGSVTLFYN